MSDQSPAPGEQQPSVPPAPPAFPPAPPAGGQIPPAPGYAPASGYGAPASGYGAPASGFDSASDGSAEGHGSGADPYAAPPYAAPPGAYGVPVGGYPAPLGGYAAPVPPPASKLTGGLSLIAALLATLVIPVVAAIIAFQIGVLVPIDEVLTENGDFVVDALSPARGQVLAIEILFWVGTAVGIAAIVLGIIATARRRGRGMGIAGMIIAVFGPGAFFMLASIMWGFGSAAAYAGSLS